MKTDITENSENELSLIVFNTEYLYKVRHRTKILSNTIHAQYEFTNKQWDVLITDLKEEFENEIQNLSQDEIEATNEYFESLNQRG